MPGRPARAEPVVATIREFGMALLTALAWTVDVVLWYIERCFW